jgi:diacylglycerol kinase family enzyme
MPARTHLFILNPHSFSNQAQMDQVIASIWNYFEPAGRGNYMLHISRFPRDAAGFISNYAKAFPPETIIRVYAAGGDGILFDCLNGIMGVPNAELAAVPWGRMNSFVRGFGRKSKSLFREISRQVDAPVIPLDVIRSGNNYALSFCTVGGESLAILHAAFIQKNIMKHGPMIRWLGSMLYDKFYYLGAVPAGLNKKVIHQYYEIEIDGEDFSGRYCIINIANGSYYGENKHPQPAAMPNDGALDILLCRSAGFLHMMRLLPAFITGRLDGHIEGVIRKRARKISIRSETPVLVNLDDIVFYDTDFTLELLPGALRFVDAPGRGYRGALADD